MHRDNHLWRGSLPGESQTIKGMTSRTLRSSLHGDKRMEREVSFFGGGM